MSRVTEWSGPMYDYACPTTLSFSLSTHAHTHTHQQHLQAPPTGGPLKALIFDSYYDAYRGVVVYFRVMDGEIRPKVRKGNNGMHTPTGGRKRVCVGGVLCVNECRRNTLA